ncbi:MAG: tetratricopeptide repeat protein [Gammaproteobacteria bacterium]|nr:tetratricopeptide repeat protein [Gammaproteobacteria bacterium]
MKRDSNVLRLLMALLLALLAASCATVPPSGTVPSGTAPPLPQMPPSESGRMRTPAVVALLNDAQQQARAGRLEDAALFLERALRIEPHNAVIWQQLAQVRLQQGELNQAVALAMKSNLVAGDDAGLKVYNWRIIAQARRKQGDLRGARAAEARAAELQGQAR